MTRTPLRTLSWGDVKLRVRVYIASCIITVAYINTYQRRILDKIIRILILRNEANQANSF